jgi:hypothetical protein
MRNKPGMVCMPAIPAHRRWRQEDCEIQASLGYVADPISNNNKKDTRNNLRNEMKIWKRQWEFGNSTNFRIHQTFILLPALRKWFMSLNSVKYR